MKLPACILFPVLLGIAILTPAWANVYTYTADDGTVFLSNMPTDKRYTLLVAEPGTQGASARPDKSRTVVSSPRNKAAYERMVEEVAQAYSLDEALLHAVISVESHYNPKAVSSKGAAGLMQLMPGTARRYGVSDSFDPLQNLHGGAKYLRDLMKLFNSDMSLALAAYNAGENAVIRNGNRIPPIRETRDYVPKVLGFYRKYLVNS